MTISAHTIQTDQLLIEDVVRQIKAINRFPCSITIYDRLLQLDAPEEAWALIHGLEIGSYFNYKVSAYEQR